MTWLFGIAASLGYLWWVQRHLPFSNWMPEAIDVSLPMGNSGYPGGHLVWCPSCHTYRGYALERYQKAVLCSCGTRYRLSAENPPVPSSARPAWEGLACPWCQASTVWCTTVVREVRSCVCGLCYRVPA